MTPANAALDGAASRTGRIAPRRRAAARRAALLLVAGSLSLQPACDALAAESSIVEAVGVIPAAAAEPDAPAERRAPDFTADIAARKSYWIPAFEIVGFDLLLNQFDRRFLNDHHDYDTSLSSIRHNLRGSWVTDNDPYAVNQLGHPYQGSMYHGFARSAGLDYWQSLGYTFAGSLFWEIAGETTPPSKNDQVASGIGGSFLGESLFRMASLLLERDNLPRRWRELGAAVISPATGFNRLAYGDRFGAVFSSRDAAYYSRLHLGASGTVQNTPGASRRLERNEALADFALEYGLPGKAGYTYTRPFDYFSFHTTLSSANGFENLTTHGLLVGKDYEVGKNYRGVWGLYGSYDYIAPQTFRVSSTALSIGTTGEWVSPGNTVAILGTGLVGAGYAAAGTLNGVRERDYHYGVAPQALLALRLVLGDRASLDLTTREYFVSHVAADRAGRGGHDNIIRNELSLTVRVHRQHAITLKYQLSRRDASYPDLGDRTQTRGTFGIFYTLLGQDRFGAFTWR